VQERERVNDKLHNISNLGRFNRIIILSSSSSSSSADHARDFGTRMRPGARGFAGARWGCQGLHSLKRRVADIRHASNADKGLIQKITRQSAPGRERNCCKTLAHCRKSAIPELLATGARKVDSNREKGAIKQGERGDRQFSRMGLKLG
jgi:hypothetical protein